MFRSTTEAPLLTEAGVLGLCVSLNSPVVNVDELPVGPARAALLLSAGDYGGLRIAVGLRSVETGTVAHFVYAGDVGDFSTPQQAMDAALAFAEAMGFLFDDDAVEAHGRAEALQSWNELAGEPETNIPAEAEDLDLDLDVGGDGDGELLLDDFAGGSDELLDDEDDARELEAIVEIDDSIPEAALELQTEIEDLPADTPDVSPAPPTAAPSSMLTKFRKSATRPEDAKTEEQSAGNALGRIPLVRRRLVAEPVRPERPGYVMRILSGF